MNLPETCCISVQGPANLLDLDGFHWGDDIIFDSTNGGLDSDAGFKKTNEILKGVVEDVLVDKCGYRQREVLLMGFGQGGMAALEYAGTSFPFSYSRPFCFTDTLQSRSTLAFRTRRHYLHRRWPALLLSSVSRPQTPNPCPHLRRFCAILRRDILQRR